MNGAPESTTRGYSGASNGRRVTLSDRIVFQARSERPPRATPEAVARWSLTMPCRSLSSNAWVSEEWQKSEGKNSSKRYYIHRIHQGCLG